MGGHRRCGATWVVPRGVWPVAGGARVPDATPAKPPMAPNAFDASGTGGEPTAGAPWDATAGCCLTSALPEPRGSVAERRLGSDERQSVWTPLRRPVCLRSRGNGGSEESDGGECDTPGGGGEDGEDGQGAHGGGGVSPGRGPGARGRSGTGPRSNASVTDSGRSPSLCVTGGVTVSRQFGPERSGDRGVGGSVPHHRDQACGAGADLAGPEAVGHFVRSLGVVAGLGGGEEAGEA